jgi:hypothetical protein
MKTLANSEDCFESRITIPVLASFHAIGPFSHVFTPYWMHKKICEKVLFIGVSWRNICQDHRRLSKQLFRRVLEAGTRSLKKVSLKIVRISEGFRRKLAKTLNLTFFTTRITKVLKESALIQKNLNLKSFKKYHLVTKSRMPKT